MHIVYAFPEPLPLPRARGIQAINAIISLAEQGLKIKFAYCSTEEDPFIYYSVAQHPNIELVPLSRGLPWPLHKLKAHSNRLFLMRLREWIKNSNEQFDYIFVRHLKLAYGLLTASRIPLIYEAHEVFSETVPQEKKEKIARMESILANHAKIIIANSQATAKCLQKTYSKNRQIYVLPNGVTIPKIKPEKDWAHAKQHIVYAGSLFAWKGVEDLILAAQQLPGHHIKIIGGTQENIDKLMPLITDKGAKISFLGQIPHRAVMQHLSEACIAVLPNRADTDSRFTSPIKLFEYMAAGCAVVATDLPVFKEILGKDEAVWSLPGNPIDLADAIRKLAGDSPRAEKMGEKLKNKANDFTWQTRAAKLKKILSDNLNEKSV